MAELPLLPLLIDDVAPGMLCALSEEGVPHLPISAETVRAGRFILFDSRRTGRPSPVDRRQTVIDTARIGSGDSAALEDQSHRWRQWSIDGVTLRERVARRDRAFHRRQLMRRLRQVIEASDGVWMTVSPYPFPYRSVFNLRIDYDRYDAVDFRGMLDTLEQIDGFERATSHFICGAAYQGHRNALKRLRGLDVGSHGFHHHTYRSVGENLRNISRGIDVLRSAGIEPSGFVAPGGLYTEGLGEAMDRLDISHAGEFALAYDDLPFTPLGRRTLQLPIHPICLGLFLDAIDEPREAARRLTAHWIATARRFYLEGRPIVLYGHPTGRLGRHPSVLTHVFREIQSLGSVWPVTLTRWAGWWRTRSRIRVSVARQREWLVVTATGLPRQRRAAIELARGARVARLPLDERGLRITPSALAWEPRPELETGLHSRQVAAPDGLRGHIRRWLDWEKETPWPEIPTDSLRNRAKRLLRKMQSRDADERK